MCNEMLFPYFNQKVFYDRSEKINSFGFNKEVFSQMIENVLEGQLDTGKTLRAFYNYATKLGVVYLTGAKVI